MFWSSLFRNIIKCHKKIHEKLHNIHNQDIVSTVAASICVLQAKANYQHDKNKAIGKS